MELFVPEYGWFPIVEIPIALTEINPYDDHHPPFKEMWDQDDYDYHLKGITLVAQAIWKGRVIRPIAIRERVKDYFNMGSAYERLDGYKRYMAHYFHPHQVVIACVIMPAHALTDCQNGQSFVVQNGDVR